MWEQAEESLNKLRELEPESEWYFMCTIAYIIDLLSGYSHRGMYVLYSDVATVPFIR